jgi:enoyl-CoA hydratase/carnithine racemase
MSSLVTFAEDAGIGVITLNTPPLNLITRTFMDDLASTVDAATRSSARVVAVKAEGDHFGAGADAWDTYADVRSSEARPRIVEWLNTLRKLKTLPAPVNAQVQGTGVGGGLELALYCDFIVAAASTKFGHLEANLCNPTLLGRAQRVAERVWSGAGTLSRRRRRMCTNDHWG